MKMKVILLALFVLGVVMVLIYWQTGRTVVGGIGYIILFLAFILSFVVSMLSRKK